MKLVTSRKWHRKLFSSSVHSDAKVMYKTETDSVYSDVTVTNWNSKINWRIFICVMEADWKDTKPITYNISITILINNKMTQPERAALIYCMVPTFPMMHDLSHLEPEVGNQWNEPLTLCFCMLFCYWWLQVFHVKYKKTFVYCLFVVNTSWQFVCESLPVWDLFVCVFAE